MFGPSPGGSVDLGLIQPKSSMVLRLTLPNGSHYSSVHLTVKNEGASSISSLQLSDTEDKELGIITFTQSPTYQWTQAQPNTAINQLGVQLIQDIANNPAPGLAPSRCADANDSEHAAPDHSRTETAGAGRSVTYTSFNMAASVTEGK
jgi:hypothetical protein